MIVEKLKRALKLHSSRPCFNPELKFMASRQGIDGSLAGL
jgi:hypothetical protein